MNTCKRCTLGRFAPCTCERACATPMALCAARQGEDMERSPWPDPVALAHSEIARNEERMSPFERRRRAGQLPVADITGFGTPRA